MKYHDHSQHANTSNAERYSDSAGTHDGWSVRFEIDPVTGNAYRFRWVPPEERSGKDWMLAMHKNAGRYPLAAEDIVLPPGYTLNPDGSASYVGVAQEVAA